MNSAFRMRDVWDRFVVPLPFSTVHFVYGAPLRVERRGDSTEAANELTRRLDAAEAEAERRARREEEPLGLREA